MTAPANRVPWWLEELSLLALTTSAAAGLARLFSDLSYFPPLFAVALATHAVSAILFRTGRRAAVSIAVGSAVGLLVVAWVTLPHVTTYGLPTLRTLEAARHELTRAWDLFETQIAPVDVERGFVLAAAVAVCVIAVVSHWAAFRLGVVVEAVIPSFTMFVFAATLGADLQRVSATTVYLGALMLFLGVRRITTRTEGATWLEARAGDGLRASGRHAATMGGAALALAVIVAPMVPGVDSAGELPWRKGDLGQGGGSRVTLSPLVDIRSRLVNQPDVEAFRVQTAERSYWRLTSLDEFDGRIWSSVGSYRDAGGDLPGTPPSIAFAPLLQVFEIENLASIWLPAAYEPAELVDAPDGISYDPESGSLLTEADTADGLTYSLTSVRPRVSKDLLEAAGVAPDDPRYLGLPDDFPSRVSELARDIALGGGAASPYEQARRLQDWFRREFTYDLSVPSGHSDSAIEAFLFTSRRGYCEQFAGSFAAMARALGLPARVAVGFTPGELADDGYLHVRGEHAHAWPEVNFDGVGWVAFEPTPGRGAPGALDYTGVPETQARAGDSTTATTAEITPTSQTNGTAPPTSAPPRPQRDPETTTGSGAEDTTPSFGRFLVRAASALAIAAVAALVVLAALALRRRIRRSRRRHAAQTPAEQVGVAWLETAEALSRAGYRRRAPETFGEYSERVARRAVVDGGALRDLALLAERTVFAPGDPSTDEAERAAEQASAVVGSLRRGLPPARRFLWLVDPKVLEP